MTAGLTREQIAALGDKALKSLIASTNPKGRFASEVVWSKEELTRRGVDFSDCLEPDQ